jgi:hypothetical protein
METTGLFSQTNQDIRCSQLCIITKDRIESFLPGLWDDLFKINPKPKSNPADTVETQKQVLPETKASTEPVNLVNNPTLNVDNTKASQVNNYSFEVLVFSIFFRIFLS